MTLKALVAMGKIEKIGTGRKGDKHCYRIRFPVPTLVLESGTESLNQRLEESEHSNRSYRVERETDEELIEFGEKGLLPE